MSKHNYSQYSNKRNENKFNATPEVTVEVQNGVISDAITEEVETTVAETTVAETTVAETTVAETTVPETTVAETTAEVAAETETTTESNTAAVATGVVAKCAKLNVRSKPSTDGDVVTVINAGDKVSIDVDKSTDEWLKIRTADGVKGFCMKKFVNANI